MPTQHSVDILGMAFTPDSIAVAVGDTVTWTNKDDFAHTVTADGGAFDSSDIDTDSNFSYMFDKVGDFPYHCEIHKHMKGTVKVS